MSKKHIKKISRAFIVFILIFAVIILAGTASFAYSGKISDSVLGISVPVAKKIEAEGIVLLKNDDAVLPLKNKKVNVFGTGSVSPFIGGTGSGAVTVTNPIDFYKALDTDGIQYNTELKSIYQNWYKPKSIPNTNYTIVNNALKYLFLGTSMPEMPVANLTDSVMENAKAYSDTAIIMLSRTGIENADFTEKDLQLTDAEKALVELVTSSFKNVIVLFNTANIMEMNWLDSYKSIKAVALIWIPGETGFDSVAKMLKGEVNPSGKLTDTISYKISDNPSNENFGEYKYTGNSLSDNYFIDYKEGIYVGYRYFETFAPEKVQYPFGYGLSYTKFKWDIAHYSADKDTVSVTVKVTNTGSMAGKDVVEVYYSPPYTPGGIEKSKIVLGGYAKTDMIKPGKSAAVTVKFNTVDMASYDYKDKQAWVLDKGTYKIKVGTDVRSFAGTFEYTVNKTRVIKNDSVTGKTIGNLFGSANGGLTYLSRADAKGTYPTPPADFSAPDAVLNADKLPAVTKTGTAPATGVNYKNGVITLSDVAKNDSLWDAFLDQFTLDEMINMVADCGYKTTGVQRLGVPATVDNDGPAEVKGANAFLYTDSGVAYPAATVLACTWNDALAEEFGEAVGTEANDIGTNIWYAPAVNIHRNPRGGRNFEYYSEDPLLSGKIGAAVVRGARSKNIVVTVKHFAVNDQETDRSGLFTWANEQSLREIYLKAFEITVKEGGASGMMAAFNRIGTQWCGADRTLTVDLLRNEWGFNGYIVSDFSFNFTGTGYMSPALAVYGRTDAILSGLWVLQAPSAVISMKAAYYRDPIGFGQALRTCVKDLCRMKMQTNAFVSK